MFISKKKLLFQNSEVIKKEYSISNQKIAIKKKKKIVRKFIDVEDPRKHLMNKVIHKTIQPIVEPRN